jgi:hypothetical protein
MKYSLPSLAARMSPMKPNPYESPRELSLSREKTPQDHSREQATRWAIRVFAYAALYAFAGLVALIVLGRLP